jgi:hypothetical protein
MLNQGFKLGWRFHATQPSQSVCYQLRTRTGLFVPRSIGAQNLRYVYSRVQGMDILRSQNTDEHTAPKIQPDLRVII